MLGLRQAQGAGLSRSVGLGLRGLGFKGLVFRLWGLGFGGLRG